MRHRGLRHAARDGADDRNAAALKVQRHHGQCRQQHDDQRPRCSRQSPRKEKKQGEDRRGQDRRRKLQLVPLSHDRADLSDDGGAPDLDPGHLAELADHHQHRDPRHVADQHRPGEEVRHEAEPTDPEHQAQPSHGKGESGRDVGVRLLRLRDQGFTATAVIQAVLDSGPTES